MGDEPGRLWLSLTICPLAEPPFLPTSPGSQATGRKLLVFQTRPPREGSPWERADNLPAGLGGRLAVGSGASGSPPREGRAAARNAGWADAEQLLL